MHKLLFLIFSILTFASVKAQMPSNFSGMDLSQRTSFNQYHSLSDSISSDKKWSLTKYASISASYAFFRGGSASILSAPIGLQLNRKLNKNLYAFAGVSVAPSYINFNQSFNNSNFNKNYPGSNLSGGNNFGIYSRAEMGLMYVNDQKTFSISGSIGIERSSYPAYGYPSNRSQQPPVMHSRQ